MRGIINNGKIVGIEWKKSSRHFCVPLISIRGLSICRDYPLEIRERKNKGGVKFTLEIGFRIGKSRTKVPETKRSRRICSKNVGKEGWRKSSYDHKRYDNISLSDDDNRPTTSTIYTTLMNHERNWRVAGANDLTMPSFCPIMDRLLSPWIPAIVRISRHVAVQIEFVPFRSRAFARYEVHILVHIRSGGVRGGVPPISTFSSIRLLVRGGKGGCYSTEGTSCPSLPFLPFNSLFLRYIVALPIPPSLSSSSSFSPPKALLLLPFAPS